MQKVADGLYVQVDYKGTLANGDVFDSSEGRQPLEVKMGAGQLIKGFEAALMGMAPNDKKTFTLSPAEAYGDRDESRTHSFPRADIPQGMEVEVGQTIGLSTPQGQRIPATVIIVDDEQVAVDLNHPLAGQSLTFDIEVVGISETPTQISAGCGCDCGSDSAGGGCDPSQAGCGSGGCG